MYDVRGPAAAVTTERWWAPAKAVARRTGAAACHTTTTLHNCVLDDRAPAQTCVRAFACICVCVCPRATAAAVHRTTVAVRRKGAASGPTRASYIRRKKLYIRARCPLIVITLHAKLYPPQHHTHSSLRLNGTKAVTPVVVLSGFFF